MRQLDLQPALRGCRTLAKDLEDQARPVDDLALELFLEVALLDRRKRTVDNDQLGVRLVAGHADALDLPFTEQGGGADGTDRQDEGIDHFDADGAGEALPLFKAAFRIGAKSPSPLLDIGEDDNGARATGDFTGNLAGVVAKFKSTQESSPSQSPVRST